MLVVSNYDNNTVSVIDVSLDVYGNDSPNFGKVLATVPVGMKPAAVTVLQDGSRAYTANQGDGTVTVVNLTNFTAQKTIPLGMGSPNPRTIVSTYNYPSGKVYVSFAEPARMSRDSNGYGCGFGHDTDAGQCGRSAHDDPVCGLDHAGWKRYHTEAARRIGRSVEQTQAH